MLTNQFSLKPRGLLARNMVITLGGMLESRDIFDSQDEKKFFFVPEVAVNSTPVIIVNSSTQSHPNITSSSAILSNETNEVIKVKKIEEAAATTLSLSVEKEGDSIGRVSNASSLQEGVDRKLDETIEVMKLNEMHFVC